MSKKSSLTLLGIYLLKSSLFHEDMKKMQIGKDIVILKYLKFIEVCCNVLFTADFCVELAIKSARKRVWEYVYLSKKNQN